MLKAMKRQLTEREVRETFRNILKRKDEREEKIGTVYEELPCGFFFGLGFSFHRNEYFVAVNIQIGASIAQSNIYIPTRPKDDAKQCVDIIEVMEQLGMIEE